MKELINTFIAEMAAEKGLSFTENTDLFENGVLDSLGIIRLLIFLDEKMHIKINIEDLQIDCFQSLTALYDFIEKKYVYE